MCNKVCIGDGGIRIELVVELAMRTFLDCVLVRFGALGAVLMDQRGCSLVFLRNCIQSFS